MKEFLSMFVQWLIAHPLSVSKPAHHQFEEMVKHPELFKVDWRVALCSCWLEFFELLKCIFAQDRRTLTYFECFDVAP